MSETVVTPLEKATQRLQEANRTAREAELKEDTARAALKLAEARVRNANYEVVQAARAWRAAGGNQS